MSFNISTFISNLQYDGLRTNLFDVYITGPKGMGCPVFTYRAKATTIPASQIATASLFYYGREVKVAGNRDFDTWTCTIFMDEEDYNVMNPRGFFEQWCWNINQHENNARTIGYTTPNIFGYFGQATIYHRYKDASGWAGVYIMQDCFPIEVSEMTLDWGDVNRIAEFQVTFAYQWWESVGEGTLPASPLPI